MTTKDREKGATDASSVPLRELEDPGQPLLIERIKGCEDFVRAMILGWVSQGGRFTEGTWNRLSAATRKRFPKAPRNRKTYQYFARERMGLDL